MQICMQFHLHIYGLLKVWKCYKYSKNLPKVALIFWAKFGSFSYFLRCMHKHGASNFLHLESVHITFKVTFFTVTFHKRFVKINEPQPTLLFFQRGLLVTYWSESQSLGHKTRYKVPFHQRKLPPKSASIYLVLEAKFYSYWQGKGQWNSNKSLKDLRMKTGGKQFSRLFSILKLCTNWIAKSYHFTLFSSILTLTYEVCGKEVPVKNDAFVKDDHKYEFENDNIKELFFHPYQKLEKRPSRE